ncbi:hypothetical protein G6F59_016790 [Rhizopus arrhizus]|nr:hypothetical protein G6F59_016790 [Rhizopus arrhizus]
MVVQLTRLRPPALARYSWRSASEISRCSASRCGRRQHRPMLTVMRRVAEPMSTSSAAMRLPMALAVTKSSSLARSKEPRRAAASNAWMAASGGSRTSLEGEGPRMIVWRAGRAPDEKVATERL